jgi:hypothetical protein
MPQRATHGRKRDAGVAARGLGDAGAGPEGAAPVGLFHDEERHPVLDAAGEIQRFLLGVDDARLAPVEEVHGHERGVADEAMQAGETLAQARTGRRGRYGHGATSGP